MTPALKAKYEERDQCVAQARAIDARSGGKPTREDIAEQDKLLDRFDALRLEIKDDERRASRLSSADAELNASLGRRTETRIGGDEPGSNYDPRKPVQVTYGTNPGGKPVKCEIRPDDPNHRTLSPEYEQAAYARLLGAAGIQGPRAVAQVDVMSSGGYLTMPERMNAELIQELNLDCVIRDLARKFTIGTTQSLGTPSRTARAASFTFTEGELIEPTADTALKFEKRILKPHRGKGLIEVSVDLLESDAMPVQEIVNFNIVQDVGYTLETKYMTGSGAGEPLGIFTSSLNGIYTDRDITGTGAAGTIVGDDFLDAKYSIKAPYRRSKSMGWIGGRGLIKRIAKLKTSCGEYLWKGALRDGEPDTVAGIPYRESEFAPDVWTSGLYVAALIDLNWYWIADGVGLQIKVLDQPKATKGQVQFLYRLATDGAPVQSLAAARIKLP